MGMEVKIVSPREAKPALDVVQVVATVSWVILFQADRWYPVEHVAIAYEQEKPIGLATLAPTDDMGEEGPHIIGIWVHPDHRRQGIGSALLNALCNTSLEVYGVAPSLVPVTHSGAALVQEAQRTGIQIISKSVHGYGDLP